jgi:hypothetical protein
MVDGVTEVTVVVVGASVTVRPPVSKVEVLAKLASPE